MTNSSQSYYRSPSRDIRAEHQVPAARLNDPAGLRCGPEHRSLAVSVLVPFQQDDQLRHRQGLQHPHERRYNVVSTINLPVVRPALINASPSYIAEFNHSELVIYNAKAHHSGNYSCEPSNAVRATVLVQIFEGN